MQEKGYVKEVNYLMTSLKLLTFRCCVLVGGCVFAICPLGYCQLASAIRGDNHLLYYVSKFGFIGSFSCHLLMHLPGEQVFQTINILVLLQKVINTVPYPGEEIQCIARPVMNVVCKL